MSHPTLIVTERVRQRLRAERIDPSAAGEQARLIAQAEVRRHNDLALSRGSDTIDDEAGCVREIMASVSGYGALQSYLDDPEIEEIWLNAPDKIFFSKGGKTTRAPLRLTDAAVRDLVERMLHTTGRRVDISQPFVDASLPDGSRLHVVKREPPSPRNDETAPEPPNEGRPEGQGGANRRGEPAVRAGRLFPWSPARKTPTPP